MRSIGPAVPPEARDRLLAGHAAAVETARATDPTTDRPAWREAFTRVTRNRTAYIRTLTVRVVSRCPHTGLELLLPIDDLGLDGLWWDHEAPARATGGRLGTCYAITGAMALAAVEDTPHLSVVGPAIPYVVPRLLEPAGTTAVVSSLPIGDHAGYVIAYFAPPGTTGLPSTDEWGTGRWWSVDADGRARWSSRAVEYQESDDAELHETRDPDLATWIEQGRVQWIAPEDETTQLRTSVDGCPYLDLDGTLDDQWVVAARVL